MITTGLIPESEKVEISLENIIHNINANGMLENVIHVIHKSFDFEEKNENKNDLQVYDTVKESTLLFFHNGVVHTANGFSIEPDTAKFGGLYQAISLMMGSAKFDEQIEKIFSKYKSFKDELLDGSKEIISFYFVFHGAINSEKTNSQGDEAFYNFIDLINIKKEEDHLKIIIIDMSDGEEIK